MFLAFPFFAGTEFRPRKFYLLARAVVLYYTQTMTTYQHTHESVRDGSPAMFISEDNEANTYVLMNEDGHTWTDSQDFWISLAELAQEEYENEQHYSQSGEEFMADYYNSDSYINYLNG